MSDGAADAIVIGSGPNGLVAANLLADAGWSVVVHEAASVAGGAVRTAELTVPGFHHDVFSAFYPFAASSPVMAALRLEDHGLQWCRAPVVLGHPVVDGPAAVLSTDAATTEGSLERFARGDGLAWRALLEPWWRSDPTRSPPGTETAWAYTHVPQRPQGDAATRRGPRFGSGEAIAMTARFIATGLDDDDIIRVSRVQD